MNLIDKDYMKNIINEKFDHIDNKKDLQKIIDNIPIVNKPKYAKCLKVSDYSPRFACSNCRGRYNNKSYVYCPYCGSKFGIRGD